MKSSRPATFPKFRRLPASMTAGSSPEASTTRHVRSIGPLPTAVRVNHGRHLHSEYCRACANLTRDAAVTTQERVRWSFELSAFLFYCLELELFSSRIKRWPGRAADLLHAQSRRRLLPF